MTTISPPIDIVPEVPEVPAEVSGLDELYAPTKAVVKARMNNRIMEYRGYSLVFSYREDLPRISVFDPDGEFSFDLGTTDHFILTELSEILDRIDGNINANRD